MVYLKKLGCVLGGDTPARPRSIRVPPSEGASRVHSPAPNALASFSPQRRASPRPDGTVRTGTSVRFSPSLGARGAAPPQHTRGSPQHTRGPPPQHTRGSPQHTRDRATLDVVPPRHSASPIEARHSAPGQRPPAAQPLLTTAPWPQPSSIQSRSAAPPAKFLRTTSHQSATPGAVSRRQELSPAPATTTTTTVHHHHHAEPQAQSAVQLHLHAHAGACVHHHFHHLCGADSSHGTRPSL